MKYYFLIPMVTMLFLSQEAFSQFDKNAEYNLSPDFQPTKSLSVAGDDNGYPNVILLEQTLTGGQSWTNQSWRIIPVKGMQGHFYLSPVATQTALNPQPVKTLDVINDGEKNMLKLDNPGNLTGQFWKITPIQGMKGYFRLSSAFQPTKSLDVANDGERNMVLLGKTDKKTGQFWKITIIK